MIVQHSKNKIIIFLIISLFWSCHSLVLTSKNESLIDMIIHDYYNTQTKYTTKYNYFNVDKFISKEKCIFCYRISPQLNNFYIPSVNYDILYHLPTNYKEINGKIFFWRNSKEDRTSQKMVKFLNSKGLIDSSYVKYELGKIDKDSIETHIVTNKNLEAVNYIICKKTPYKVKKKIKLPGYYSYKKMLKKINCQCK